MPKYKHTAALEACPAKTAETVSYGATFAVLGWLLLSNYSGLGYGERDNQTIASVEPPYADRFAAAASTISQDSASAESLPLDEMSSSAATGDLLELEDSSFVTSPPAWHADLSSFQQYESQAHQRAFSTAEWNGQASHAEQQITGFIEGLELALPVIDTSDLFDVQNTALSISNGGLASNAANQTELVREITVTSTEEDRLRNRPDNIQRPQIPRPYRAQEIQRSFILPPRIQALKP